MGTQRKVYFFIQFIDAVAWITWMDLREGLCHLLLLLITSPSKRE